MAKRKSPEQLPMTDRLRHQRVDVLRKSVRDVAKLLDTSPIHISDIETGKRTPSEELLVRMAGVYRIDESELRAAFDRPQSEATKLLANNAAAVDMAPEFLRTAKGWSREQWAEAISHGKRMNQKRKGD